MIALIFGTVAILAQALDILWSLVFARCSFDHAHDPAVRHALAVRRWGAPGDDGPGGADRPPGVLVPAARGPVGSPAPDPCGSRLLGCCVARPGAGDDGLAWADLYDGAECIA